MEKFKVAFKGLVDGFKDKSILIQYILGFIAIIVALVIRVSMIELMVIIICIGLVISGEYFNTAIERLADLVTTKTDERVRYIKDLSAAAVLMQAIVSLIIMIIIISRIIGGI